MNTLLATNSDWPCCLILLGIGLLIYLPYAWEDFQKSKQARIAREQREKREHELEEARQRDAEPANEEQVNCATSFVCKYVAAECTGLRIRAKRRHPLIKFRSPNLELLAGEDRVHRQLNGVSTGNLDDAKFKLANDAVDLYRFMLSTDFEAHSTDLVIREIADGTYGPLDDLERFEFWANEERQRDTTRGTKAEDWSLRREAVYRRDHGICLRCGAKVSLEECHIHHVEKSKHGGTNHLSNLATLCRDCHCMMPDHEHMRATTSFAIYEGEVHRRNCLRLPQRQVTVKKSVWNRSKGRWGKRKRNVKEYRANLDGLLVKPYNIALEREGVTPCPVCEPDELYFAALERWLPRVLRSKNTG